MIVFGTGSSGFVGRHFVPILLSHLGPTDKLYLLERQRGNWNDPRIEVLIGDLEHIAEQKAALLESHWVFHLGGNAVFDEGAVYDVVNAEPVRVMADLLKSSRVLERFVLISTIGALDRSPRDRVDEALRPDSSPHPTSDYGRSKLKAEEHLRASGLPFTIIRPAWVYGGGMRRRSHLSVLVDLVVSRSPLVRLRFPGKAPLIHVRDLCEAMVQCLTTPASAGRTYLAVTENRSLGEILAILEARIRGGNRRGIPVPRLHALFSLIHRWLPLSLNGLFLDYLAADDPEFRRDLLPSSPIAFESGVDDVLSRHPALAGRWLVTGANSGIGRALVAALTSRGSKVIAVDRDISNLTPSDQIEVIEADLTEPAAIERVARAAAGWPLEVLVNNAGVGHRGDFVDQPREHFDTAVRVNILATLALTHALRRQIVSDGTTVVNMASSVAYHPLPHMSVYAATKSFVLNWSLALAEELRPGNRVVTFSPSGTRTNFQRAGGVRGADSSGLLSPEEVAEEILRAVQKGRLHTLMGWKSRLLVYGSVLLPVRWKLRVWSRLFSASR